MTSLIDVLELPNFGYMTTFAMLFESHDTILLVTPWVQIMTL